MSAEPPRQPEIGTDTWVAQHEQRVEVRRQPLSRLLKRLDRVPITIRVIVVVALLALLPTIDSSDYIQQVAVNCALLALLALGLNVVVGMAGMLDLGYTAFYGIGAYMFAFLASPQLGHHWPSIPALLVVAAATAGVGVLVGLPSRRLTGDYLAIVTLFFGQLFVTLATNADRIQLPWQDEPLDLTGGPNGIVGVDAIRVLGEPFPTKTLFSVADYYYLLLVLFGIVMIVLYRLSASRTGRAVRALREDPLAAAQMTIPVFRLRIFAFAVGAAIAGLTGAVFASQQISVFPANFDVMVLITIYAAVVLGGEGSQAGVVLGAVIVTILPEILRDAGKAELLFYGAILVLLVVRIRPWSRLAIVLGGTLVFGEIVWQIGNAITPNATAGQAAVSGWWGDFIEHWVLLPTNNITLGNYAFVALVFALLGLSLVKDSRIQAYLLIPILYLAAFVWENRLIIEPTTTRLILFGALLVMMMVSRPQGIMGRMRVELV
jgi:branched-chain amino acid transport system permease protein